jgi:pyruvate dehydrogenase E2 component (dihydrolipoamide acetyltransferase)
MSSSKLMRHRVIASPRARRAMQGRGIDPAAVHGTGPGGRIVEADVLRAVAGRTAAGEGLSPMRRAVAAKVAESVATIPHFYLRATADVTLLVQLRQQLVEPVQERCGQRPSLTDFLLRATALALRDCPQANRVWQQGSIVELAGIDVGLVVKVGDGLMVPIIHGADRLGLVELVGRRAELVAAVQAGRLPAESLQGGATALTNLGRHRVDEFAAIISPPQSSMVAVGRAALRPAEHEGRLCLRQTLHLTLSADHRVMDGDPAAGFLDRIVELLENPLLLICETT